MAWNITGQFFESCSCNMLCPCWFGVKELMVMDQGWCDGAHLVRVQQGSSDSVDLSGRTVVVANDFPGPTLIDGNGTARIYIDDGASPEHRRELEAIFQGRRGGPMEIFASLISQWLPTQTANIEIQEEGDAFTATVGSFGRYSSQRLRDEAGQLMTMQNVGFAGPGGFQFENATADLAPSGSRWSDPEMPRQFETKSGAVGHITWSGS